MNSMKLVLTELLEKISIVFPRRTTIPDPLPEITNSDHSLPIHFEFTSQPFTFEDNLSNTENINNNSGWSHHQKDLTSDIIYKTKSATNLSSTTKGDMLTSRHITTCSISPVDVNHLKDGDDQQDYNSTPLLSPNPNHKLSKQSPVKLLHLGYIDYTLSSHPVEAPYDCENGSSTSLTHSMDTEGDIEHSLSNICHVSSYGYQNMSNIDDSTLSTPVTSYVYGRSLSPASSMNENETLCGANGGVTDRCELVHLTLPQASHCDDKQSHYSDISEHPSSLTLPTQTHSQTTKVAIDSGNQSQASSLVTQHNMNDTPLRDNTINTQGGAHIGSANHMDITKSAINNDGNLTDLMNHHKGSNVVPIEDIDRSTTDLFRQRFPYLYALRRYEQQLDFIKYKSDRNIPIYPVDSLTLLHLEQHLADISSSSTLELSPISALKTSTRSGKAIVTSNKRNIMNNKLTHEQKSHQNTNTILIPTVTTQDSPRWPLVAKKDEKLKCKKQITTRHMTKAQVSAITRHGNNTMRHVDMPVTNIHADTPTNGRHFQDEDVTDTETDGFLEMDLLPVQPISSPLGSGPSSFHTDKVINTDINKLPTAQANVLKVTPYGELSRFAIDLTRSANRGVNPMRIIPYQEHVNTQQQQYKQIKQRFHDLITKMKKEYQKRSAKIHAGTDSTNASNCTKNTTQTTRRLSQQAAASLSNLPRYRMTRAVKETISAGQVGSGIHNFRKLHSNYLEDDFSNMNMMTPSSSPLSFDDKANNHISKCNKRKECPSLTVAHSVDNTSVYDLEAIDDLLALSKPLPDTIKRQRNAQQDININNSPLVRISTVSTEEAMTTSTNPRSERALIQDAKLRNDQKKYLRMRRSHQPQSLREENYASPVQSSSSPSITPQTVTTYTRKSKTIEISRVKNSQKNSRKRNILEENLAQTKKSNGKTKSFTGRNTNNSRHKELVRIDNVSISQADKTRKSNRPITNNKKKPTSIGSVSTSPPHKRSRIL